MKFALVTTANTVVDVFLHSTSATEALELSPKDYRIMPIMTPAEFLDLPSDYRSEPGENPPVCLHPLNGATVLGEVFLIDSWDDEPYARMLAEWECKPEEDGNEPICSICQCEGLEEDTGFICTSCSEELEELHSNPGTARNVEQLVERFAALSEQQKLDLFLYLIGYYAAEGQKDFATVVLDFIPTLEAGFLKE